MPEGNPSTTTPTALQWDSPKVVIRNNVPNVLDIFIASMAPRALNRLGIALEKQGKTELAVLCFRKALNIEEELPEVHCNLGNALNALGKEDEAAACYQQALNIEPGCTEAREQLNSFHTN